MSSKGVRPRAPLAKAVRIKKAASRFGVRFPGRTAFGRSCSRADGCRRGFTLIEALVALVVAGLMLPAVARALGAAWSATRTPMDIVSAMVLARDVAAGGLVPDDARSRGYAAERTNAPATVLILPSDVAPAPVGTGKDENATDLKPEATPAAVRLAVPKGFDAPPAGAAHPNLTLRRVTVVVRSPAGRHVTLTGLRLDDASH